MDADPAKWKVTQAMLEREIEKARVAREEHEGEAGEECDWVWHGVKKSCHHEKRRYDRAMLRRARA